MRRLAGFAPVIDGPHAAREAMRSVICLARRRVQPLCCALTGQAIRIFYAGANSGIYASDSAFAKQRVTIASIARKIPKIDNHQDAIAKALELGGRRAVNCLYPKQISRRKNLLPAAPQKVIVSH